MGEFIGGAVSPSLFGVRDGARQCGAVAVHSALGENGRGVAECAQCERGVDGRVTDAEHVGSADVGELRAHFAGESAPGGQYDGAGDECVAAVPGEEGRVWSERDIDAAGEESRKAGVYADNVYL